MNNLVKLLPVIILFALNSCYPKVRSSLRKAYAPLASETEVKVLGLGSLEPADAEVIGYVRVGDSGFSTNCGYDVVLDSAKVVARNAGGNAILITKHQPPSRNSNCHRITARILLINTNKTAFMTIREAESSGIDYAILNIYRQSVPGDSISFDLFLGDSLICRVDNSMKSSLKIRKSGAINLWAKTEPKSEVPIDIRFGRIYYIRCGAVPEDAAGHPVLRLVEPETGLQEFEAVK